MESTPNELPGAAAASPWWKHGHVWLLVSGPAVVVVASLVTGWVAVRGADPVIGSGAGRSIEVKTAAARERALLPAVQARNHAALPVPAVRPTPAP